MTRDEAIRYAEAMVGFRVPVFVMFDVKRNEHILFMANVDDLVPCVRASQAELLIEDMKASGMEKDEGVTVEGWREGLFGNG
jgi:hypothetical protein